MYSQVRSGEPPWLLTLRIGMRAILNAVALGSAVRLDHMMELGTYRTPSIIMMLTPIFRLRGI